LFRILCLSLIYDYSLDALVARLYDYYSLQASVKRMVHFLLYTFSFLLLTFVFYLAYMKIRTATEKDLEAINHIYNQVIPYKMSTADTEPYTMDERLKWYKAYDRLRYPVFVADTGDEVAGYFSFSPYRPRRMAMRYTAEISYFVDEKYRNIGIGTSLMAHAIGKAPEYNFKTLIAILLSHNAVSIKLLEKFGFSEWGRMPGVADFQGKERDHLYYGLRIG